MCLFPIGAPRSTHGAWGSSIHYFSLNPSYCTSFSKAPIWKPKGDIQSWHHSKYWELCSCDGQSSRETPIFGAVQPPATDNVNKTQLWWRVGLRGLVNCHVSYRPSEHDTCTTTHIPHCHALRFQGFIVKHSALSPVGILIRFSF